jgi:hypothetical protein
LENWKGSLAGGPNRYGYLSLFLLSIAFLHIFYEKKELEREVLQDMRPSMAACYIKLDQWFLGLIDACGTTL